MDPELRKRLDALKAKAAEAAAPVSAAATAPVATAPAGSDNGIPPLPEDLRPKTAAPQPTTTLDSRPWYQRVPGKFSAALDNLSNELPSFLRGAGQGATANFGDEWSGALLDATAPSKREGIPVTYGNSAIDQLRSDNAAAQEAHPGVYSAGNVVGAVPVALASGGESLAGQLGAGTAQFVANGLGAGEGGYSDRAAQLDQDIKEHPVATSVALGAPAVGAAMKPAGQVLKNKGNELVPHIFMSFPQRALMKAQRGVDSMSQFGSDVREAGLLKPRGFIDMLSQPSARRVAENAEIVKGNAGKAIGELEDKFTAAGANPDVQVNHIADELRGKASKIDSKVHAYGKDADADAYRREADALLPTEQVNVSGKVERPPAIPTWKTHDELKTLRGPAQQSIADVDNAARAEKPRLPIVDRPATQTSLDLQGASPEPQMSLANMERSPKPEAWKPGAGPAGEQTKLPLERSGQRELPLDERGQAGLDFDQSGPVKYSLPSQGEDLQLSLDAGAEPLVNADVRPGLPEMRAVQNFKNGPQSVLKREPVPPQYTPRPGVTQPAPTGPTQLGMDLGTQRELAGTERAPSEVPWRPAGAAHVEQLDIPEARTQLGEQTRVPFTSKDAVQQEFPLERVRIGREGEVLSADAKGELSTGLPVASAETTKDMPLDHAIATKRWLADQINWGKNPNTSRTFAQDAAQKVVHAGLKDQIIDTLEREVAGGHVSPAELEAYKQANKNYGVAAQSLDPALRMAERHGQMGIGLKDYVAGALVGGGPASGAAALAHKVASSRLAGGASNTLYRSGQVMSGLAKPVSLSGRTVPQESLRERNERMSESLKRRLDGEE